MSNCIYLTPDMINSAERYYMKKKKKILAIVGESGSGKTIVTEYIKRNYDIPMIESYTTRPKRTPDEKGHTFISNEEFDNIDKKDMIAYTQWENVRYCCLHSDIKGINTYIIDERGLDMLQPQKEKYNIKALRMIRPKEERIKDVGVDRVARDNGNFNQIPLKYDYVIKNKGTKEDLYKKVDEIVGDFFK